MAFVAVLFAATFASCSDDDEGIYFTKDEIVGDINTGKKINIGNTLSLYAGYSTCVNVHGQSGNIKASTSDPNIATVEADNSGGYNDGHLTITISGKSEGTATVIITDSRNNSAELTIDVMNPIRAKYVRTNVDKDEVHVSGVTDNEAETIKAEIANIHANEQSYILEISPTKPETSRWMLHVYDTTGQLLYDMQGRKFGEGGIFYFCRPDDNFGGDYTFSDDRIQIVLTDKYKEKYPDVQVEMIIRVEKYDI